jgi:hypothetical protein
MDASSPYSFSRRARTPQTAVVVCVVWAALFFIWTSWEAATWIVLILVTFTLPALSDLIRNPESGLHLNDETLSWYSGRAEGTLERSEIDHITLNTRLDFSVSVAVVLRTGRKIKLPFEATPPHQEFEAVLNSNGIPTKRFHFQLMQ